MWVRPATSHTARPVPTWSFWSHQPWGMADLITVHSDGVEVSVGIGTDPVVAEEILSSLGLHGGPRYHLPPSATEAAPPTTSTPQTVTGSTGGGAAGQLAVSAAQFPTSQEGYVLVTDTNPAGDPAGVWLDTTTDGGRHWHTVRPRGLPAFQGSPMTFAMVSATAGWVSDGGLWATTDGGATWTRQLPGYSVAALAVTGKTAWAETDTGQFLDSPQPGAPFTALPANPPGQQVTSPVRTSPAAAYALAGTLQGPTSLVRTLDNAHHWTSLPLPCTAPAGRPDGARLLQAAPDGTLWLTCFASAQSIDPSAGAVTIYTSRDQGNHWTRHGPAAPTIRQAVRDGLLTDGLAQLAPVTPRHPPHRLGHRHRRYLRHRTGPAQHRHRPPLDHHPRPAPRGPVGKRTTPRSGHRRISQPGVGHRHLHSSNHQPHPPTTRPAPHPRRRPPLAHHHPPPPRQLNLPGGATNPTSPTTIPSPPTTTSTRCRPLNSSPL